MLVLYVCGVFWMKLDIKILILFGWFFYGELGMVIWKEDGKDCFVREEVFEEL